MSNPKYRDASAFEKLKPERSNEPHVPEEHRLPNRSELSENRPVPLFDKSSIESGPTIELLTVVEVAELLKISVSGVRRLQQGRHLPFIKIGGSVRFAKSDIAAYVGRRRVESID